ncbi:MAG: carboxypeptidase-like regulatory domain-containing protein [Daejeonella sp.]
MMQNIQLAIPEPCHENWNNMNPTEKGRFCNVCEKQVIDFSVMSDAQLLHYFSKIKDENICGRAYPDQLNRVIAAPEEIKKRKFWYWNYIAMFLLFFAKLNTAKAQRGQIIIQEQPVKNPQNVSEITEVGDILMQRNISGEITDEKDNPIPYATIVVAETNEKFTADEKGKFVFNLNLNVKNLTITANGFVRKVVKLTKNTNYKIKLAKSANAEKQIPALSGKIRSPLAPKKN